MLGPRQPPDDPAEIYACPEQDPTPDGKCVNPHRLGSSPAQPRANARSTASETCCSRAVFRLLLRDSYNIQETQPSTSVPSSAN